MFSFFTSCSKKGDIQNGGVTPPPIIIPAPTGTASPTSSTAIFGAKDTINYSFSNTDSVWVNSIFYSISGTGQYITSTLTANTNFFFKAKGKGGEYTYSVHIVVSQDPNITFLTTGTSHFDSLTYKSYAGTQFILVPTSADCPSNKHTFFANGTTPSTNEEWTFCNCTSVIGNIGDNVKHFWYFAQTGHFFWHGVEFDLFTISGNQFILHVSSLVTVNGVDHYDEYNWYYTKN